MNTIENAVRHLQSGGLVAMPTETVYGLGADASNLKAVQRIFEAKQRPMDHPLIVHISDIDKIDQWVSAMPLAAVALANAFWPGPMTLILPKLKTVLDEVTGNQSTVGIRIPKHPVALALLRAFGGGIAAPSANKYGRISPTTAAAVYEELGEAVDCILEGGQCEVGLESTIIDVSGDSVSILRPGMITREQIESVLGYALSQPTDNKPRVSGSLASHYAPLTPTRLISSDALSRWEASSAQPILLVRHRASPIIKHNIETIVMSSDPIQYAHDLYHTLRIADQKNVSEIWIESVPADSSWDAIRDRLMRAASR